MTNRQDNKTISGRFRRSLSARLLALTIVFVFIAEIVVLIPSIAKQRLDWLNARLEAAYLVGLALDAPGGEMIEPEVAEQLFSTANILGVTLDQDGARMMIMTPKLTDEQSRVMRFVNIEQGMPLNLISDAWGTIFSTGDHSIRVVGKPVYADWGKVDMFVSQAALRRDLLTYARNVLFLSLIISTFTAALVFWSLSLLTVRPIERLTRNMMAFENNPDNPSNILPLSGRLDEIGAAERGLAGMERRIQALLAERQRLAALGAGISKISHDLRNILASAQLMSDRLAKSDDPRVRKLSPRLISALDRAIALSRDTLSYARMERDVLNKETVDLHALINDVFDDCASMSVELINETPATLATRADSPQLYRALVNLIRNAVEAFPPHADDSDGDVLVSGNRVGVDAKISDSKIELLISDNGPGFPDAAREHLFEPFKGSFKPGGSGLGIAIAHEIIRAHDGELTLVKSDAGGTVFSMKLPTL